MCFMKGRPRFIFKYTSKQSTYGALTTLHKVQCLFSSSIAKARVLPCTAGASTEIQDPCVPIAWEGHRNCSPVNTSVFQGRDTKVS